MKTPMLCPKCRYNWETKSLNINVTCPSCLKKINREKNAVRFKGA